MLTWLNVDLALAFASSRISQQRSFKFHEKYLGVGLFVLFCSLFAVQRSENGHKGWCKSLCQ